MIIDIALGIVLAVIILRLLPLAIYLFTVTLVILAIAVLIGVLVYNWKIALQIGLIGLFCIAWFGSAVYAQGKLIEYLLRSIPSLNRDGFRWVAMSLAVVIMTGFYTTLAIVMFSYGMSGV